MKWILPVEITNMIIAHAIGTDPRSQPAVEQWLAGRIHTFTTAVSGFRYAFKVTGSQGLKWLMEDRTYALESKRPYLVRWWPFFKSDFKTTWIFKDGEWMPGKMIIQPKAEPQRDLIYT